MSSNAKLPQPIFSPAEVVTWLEPLPGEKVALRVDGAETGQIFAMAEAIVAPMAGPPLHIHHDTDEIIYVLDGTVDFVCEGRRLRTGRGGMVVIPKGAPHAFRNFGDIPAHLLDILKLTAEHNMEIVGPPSTSRSRRTRRSFISMPEQRSNRVPDASPGQPPDGRRPRSGRPLQHGLSHQH